MKKCSELSQDLLKAYYEKARGIRCPKVTCVKASLANSEGFELSYAGGTICVAAQNPLAESYALSLLNTVVPSGHWREFLGVSSPRYHLRPLWLRKPADDADSFHRICRRAIKLGYNALAWSGRESFQVIPGEYGLKAIAIVADDEINAISKTKAGYVLYEGSLPIPEERETLAEAIALRIYRLEQTVPAGTHLIYYVPCNEKLPPQQSAQILLSLCKETGPGTCLAFSAVAGHPAHDHLPLHPFWGILRDQPLLVGTGLLPIFNIGGIEQGEGLWPSICLEQIEQLASRCKRHSFAGCISLASTMPGIGGFSQAAHWVAGQTMWREISPSLLLETWLKAYKPDLNSDTSLSILNQARRLILSLGHLRFQLADMHHEDQRLKCEDVLLQIRLLDKSISEIEKSRRGRISQVNLYDYLSYFIRDAKRIAKQLMPSANIEEDGQESIWTKKGVEGSGRKILLLDQPNSGLPNSKLSQLIAENRS